MTSATPDPSGWRPLLRISSTGWLGVRRGGDEGALWVGDDSGPRRQVGLSRAVGCLPLLERPYSDVRDECDLAVSTCSPAVREALTALVPAGVVEAAFQVQSDYWLRGACTWLEALEPSEQTAVWAARLENAVGASQATRHAARRVRRTWTHG